MSPVGNVVCSIWFNVWQGYVQFHRQTKATILLWSDAHGRCYSRTLGRFWVLVLSGNKLHRTDETRSITCGKKLFGVVTLPPCPAQFFRCPQIDCKASVRGFSSPVSATCGAGFCRIKYCNSYKFSPSWYDVLEVYQCGADICCPAAKDGGR